MPKSEVRIEILKLIHRHDQTPELIIERGRKFEAWITEGELPAPAEALTEVKAPAAKGRKFGNVAQTKTPS